MSVSGGTVGLQYIIKLTYASSKFPSVTSFVGRLRRGEGNAWLFGVKEAGLAGNTRDPFWPPFDWSWTCGDSRA